MADQVTVDNGDGTDYVVSTDDAGASGHVQRVKIAYSADGSATHVTADADGVLVNLGANNDVTVSGVATAANQTTVIGHLDGVEGLLTTIDSDTGTLAGQVGAGGLKVDLGADNDVTITSGSVTADTELPAAAALADNAANPTAPAVAAFGMVYDGATWDRAPGTSADGVLVNLGANNDVVVSDGGSSLTVDGTVGVSGTVTVDSELPAAAALADNASNPTAPAVGSFGMVWDGATWDRAPGTAADGALVNLGANNDVTVTGTVTVQDGGSTVSVDDGGGALTVDGTVTANLAAGTNNIGDVDVLTMPATVTEDAASAGGETAVLVAGVRNDAAAARTSTDGDFGNIAIDSAGRVGVADLGGSISVDDNGSSLTVDGSVSVSSLPALAAGTNNIGDVDVASIAAGDNAIGRVKLTDGTDVADILDLTTANPLAVAVLDGNGDQITSFGGSGGTSMTDDAAFTPGTTSITPIGAMFDDTAPDSVNEGDGGVVRMSGNRNMYVTLRDAAGNERGLNVDANGAIAVTDGTGSLTVDNAALSVTGGGVEASALRVTLANDSTGVLSVDDNGSSLTVDGTVAVSSLPASTNTIEIVGDAAHDAAASGNPVLIGAEFDDTTPDGVDEGDVGRLRISSNRNLYSTIRDAAGNERGANVNASNQLSVSVDNTVTVASHAVTNAGTFATQVDGAALTALQLIDDIVKTDDAAFTPATDEVAMAGFFADETATDSVDEGDAGAARMTLDRKQVVVNQPHTAGGCSIFRSIDLDETEEEAKATAGCVYGYYIANLATSTRFVKFYNATAANVTVGTTTPVLTLPIPGNSTDDVAANMLGGVGITFDTAITVAATTGVADNDTGAPGANEVVINLYYK